MTEERFEEWYECVNDIDLRDAAYTGLVTAPVEIERLKAELERHEMSLSAVDDHGRALSFIEVIQQKDAEIRRLQLLVDNYYGKTYSQSTAETP